MIYSQFFSRRVFDLNDDEVVKKSIREKDKKRRQNEELRWTIRLRYETGSSREKIFIDLLHELHSLYISEENAIRCFKSVAEASPPIQEYFDDTYWNLLMLIVDEIERIDCCISIWNDNNTHKFLDSRYSLMFDNYDRGIYLLDNFYRRAKYVEMKTLEGKPFLISCCRIDVIAPDMFVLFDEDYNTDTFVINLCRMDYSNEEPRCIQLDSKKLDGECPKAVFDYNDRRRFVIRNEYKNETCVQLVRVEDSKLVFGGDPIQIVKGPMCARLNGNKLELLTMEYNVDNVRERVVFGEFDLTGNPKTSEFKKLFNVETRGRIQSLYHESFVWSAERCYIGNFNPSRVKQVSLLVFDINAREVTNLPHTFYCDDYFGTCMENMHLNEADQTLAICIDYRIERKNVIYRVSLNKPDSLSNISLMKHLKSQQTLKEISQRTLDRLPGYLKPLAICDK